jgi:hypothetical protein
MGLQREWNVKIHEKPQRKDEMTKVFENNDRLGNCTTTENSNHFFD